MTYLLIVYFFIGPIEKGDLFGSMSTPKPSLEVCIADGNLTEKRIPTGHSYNFVCVPK